MESLEEKVAIITGARSGNGVAVARPNRKKMIGLALCLGAVVVVVAGWTWARESGARRPTTPMSAGMLPRLPQRSQATSRLSKSRTTKRYGQATSLPDRRSGLPRKACEAVANVEAAEARLTNVDAEMALQHALIRQAEAQRRSVVAELNLAAKASDRRRELIRSNTISQAHVDESDAAKSRAEANVLAASATVEAQQQRIAVLAAQREAAVAAVAQAEAARDLAGLDLESTVVRAPVGGVIGNRQVRVGRLVAPGASLLDIVPLDNVWIVANFKETQLEHIRPGQRASITIDGYPSGALEGVVDSFSPGSGSAFSLLPADNATGNFVRVVQRVPVKIRFAGNPLSGRLLPGLSARVEIDLESGS